MPLLIFLMSLILQRGPSAIVCTVTAGGVPVGGAEIVVAGATYVTDDRGAARIERTKHAQRLGDGQLVGQLRFLELNP